MFFDTTPIGVIMNRFTRDVGIVDQIIPQVRSDFCNIKSIYLKFLNFQSLVDLNINLAQSVGIVLTTVVVCPWLLIPCVVLSAFCVPVRNIYIKTARELQRLDSIARSPVYSHISATFDGLITIRAFGLEKLFNTQYMHFLADSVSCRFLCIVGGRVIGIILDLFVTIYIAFICLLLVYLPKGAISGGDAGAILSMSILLTGMFQYTGEPRQLIIPLE